MKLTAPQSRELRALAKQPQHTYGAGRARVQNRFVSLGWAAIGADDLCRITPAGKAALAAHTRGGNR